MDINQAIKDEAAKLKGEGATLTRIRGFLAYSSVTSKDAEAFILLMGWSGSRPVGSFTQRDTLALIESGVSEFDLYAALIDAGAKNELRWINDRNKIRVVINRVMANLGSPVAEAEATGDQKAEAKLIVKGQAKPEAEAKPEASKEELEEALRQAKIKEAWEKLKNSQGGTRPNTKAKKNAFHPDRISYLNDTALTEAYTAYYQDLTN